MAKGNLHLSGYIDVPADRLAAIQTAVREHIRLTRAEPGCISFNVDPCPDVAGRFLVHETFATQADFDTHQSRARASEWAKISKCIPRSYQITTE